MFGSSSEKIDGTYLSAAQRLGAELARADFGVIFGAGKYGVMGAVARGVREAGGRLVGVSPRFFVKMNVLVEDYGELIFTDTMRERKAVMEDMADAFVICPGGIGTFEEFFEVLTLKQLGRHSKPIVILNTNGYYDSMLGMMNGSVDEGFMSGAVNRLYTVARSIDEVFEQIREYKAFGYNKYESE